MDRPVAGKDVSEMPEIVYGARAAAAEALRVM